MPVRRVSIVVLGLLAFVGVPLARADLTVGPDSPVCTVRPPTPVQPLPPPTSTTSGRVTTYTFASNAVGAVKVDVLTPLGYDASGAMRYPVLYLLHGHGGSYDDWVAKGDVMSTVTSTIVVMPDGGYDGWYSDWYGTDLDGHTRNPPAAWETFHIGELVPWVDATYPTIADRSGRAIAGLSMGGFGAMRHAARQPA